MGKPMAARGADGFAHVQIVPEQEGHGERAAADAHEARNHADDPARDAHASETGQVAGRFGLFAAEHLGDHEEEEGYEKELKEPRRNVGSQERPAERADQDAGGDVPYGIPLDALVAAVGQRAGNRCEHDAAHRRPEGHEHEYVRRKFCQPNAKTSMGTMTMPPPTPRSPARTPSNSPEQTVNNQ